MSQPKSIGSIEDRLMFEYTRVVLFPGTDRFQPTFATGGPVLIE